MKQILLIEDHAIVRLSTKVLIHGIYPLVKVHEASTYEEALACATQQLDLILLDINIPNGKGFEMIPSIRSLQPKVPILVFSGQEEQIYAVHYLKTGANGFLSKLASETEIETAVLSMLQSGTYVSPALQRQMLCDILESKTPGENPLEKLSQRELEVMDMLLAGLWTKEIAGNLHLTESSVSTYKTRIFQKLGVSNLIAMFKKVNFLKEQNTYI